MFGDYRPNRFSILLSINSVMLANSRLKRNSLNISSRMTNSAARLLVLKTGGIRTASMGCTTPFLRMASLFEVILDALFNRTVCKDKCHQF